MDIDAKTALAAIVAAHLVADFWLQIIIGTMLSFTWAIALAWLTQWTMAAVA